MPSGQETTLGYANHNDPRTLTIGLLWHSVNAPNLGIGALTISNIAIIENVAEQLGVTVRFKVFQWRDPGPDYVVRKNVEVVRLRGRHVLFHPMFMSELRKCCAVLDIGAGDSFADIYGPTRFAKIAISKICVLAARRPLLLAPQTIGPFQNSWSRFLASWLMKASYSIVSRDNLTTRYLEKLQLGSKLLEATDVAFRLPYEPKDKSQKQTIQIGINVSGLLFNGGYTGQNMFGLKADYANTIRKLIRQFQGKENCVIHLISHVVPENLPIESDFLAAEKLGTEFPDLVVVPPFKDPSAAKSYIAGMDFFCGSRMHACIAALSGGVPVVPMAYSRKFAGVFGTLGYSCLVDCKTMSSEQIVDSTMDAFARRAELALNVRQAMIVASEKFEGYEQVLRSLLLDQLGTKAVDA